MNITKTILPVTLLAFSFFSTCPTAIGQGSLIDQQNTRVTTDHYYYQPSGPVGQEFSPTLDSLDFVDAFVTYNGVNRFPDDRISYYAVEIHEGSLAGAVLAISDPNPVNFDSGGNGFWMENHFSTTVHLTPGKTYTMEFKFQSGGHSVGFGYGPRSGYPGGGAIFAGTAVDDFAMLFREGVSVVPEPSTLSLGPVGAAIACVAWRYYPKRRATRS